MRRVRFDMAAHRVAQPVLLGLMAMLVPVGALLKDRVAHEMHYHGLYVRLMNEVIVDPPIDWRASATISDPRITSYRDINSDSDAPRPSMWSGAILKLGTDDSVTWLENVAVQGRYSQAEYARLDQIIETLNPVPPE